MIASGSSKRWSPITPGFTLAAQHFETRCPLGESSYTKASRVGFARLDHDGGARLYQIQFLKKGNKPGDWLWLEPTSGEQAEEVMAGLVVAHIFRL